MTENEPKPPKEQDPRVPGLLKMMSKAYIAVDSMRRLFEKENLPVTTEERILAQIAKDKLRLMTEGPEALAKSTDYAMCIAEELGTRETSGDAPPPTSSLEAGPINDPVNDPANEPAPASHEASADLQPQPTSGDSDMTTQKQIEANRLNALKSTGPVTAEGKARVAQNGIKHGLTAESVLICDEREEEFLAFRDDLMADLKPQGAMEEIFASRIIMSAWRLRRGPRYEQQAINNPYKRDKKIFGHGHSRLPPDPLDVQASIFRHIDRGTHDKLSRYESRAEFSVQRNLKCLTQLQSKRAKESAQFSETFSPGNSQHVKPQPNAE